MNYILYNPLSNSGTSVEASHKLEKILYDKNEAYNTDSIIAVSEDVESFIKKIQPDDKVIIIGGDGTLHRFADRIKDIELPCEIFLYKAGTGNDFSREFKKQTLINITKYIQGLPSFSNDEVTDEAFLNCTGFGVDGEVCKMVNDTHESKKGLNYLMNALKTFKNFKRYDLEVTVDGVRHIFKKVWLMTIMNGNYFGGGMKLSPVSDRTDDTLELYVVHSLGLVKLLLIFPLIFIGKHMAFKSQGITLLKGKEFHCIASEAQVFQSDGEVTLSVKEFTVKR